VPAPTVLVVEDDSDIRDVIAAVLEIEGYAVSTATNGAEALDQLARRRFDLLVTDLMMPVMNGWSLVAEVRGRPELAAMRVLVITAHLSAKVPGADRILSKPFDLRSLLGEITTLLLPLRP
jgi:CheY-like chemotaxis protein